MLTFTKGERLTADKMNALASQLGAGDVSIPSLGFNGKTLWQQDKFGKMAHNVPVPETF